MRRKDKKIEGAQKTPPGGGRPSPGISPRGTRLIVAALCLMVCAVPLVYLPGIYEYELLPKLLALHLCIALCCLGWLVQTRWGRTVRLVSSPLLLPALCFMGVALLSAWATTHPLDTAVELVNQAALLVLLFVVANALPLECFRPVLWSSALTGLAVALIGILQYHGLTFLDIPSSAPPSATFANRNLAAEYLICAAPLSGLLFLTARRRPARILSGLSAALMGVYLIYTRTRGAWVGAAGALLCVGGALAFWPTLRRPVWEAVRSEVDSRKRRMALGLLVLFVVLSTLPPLRSTATVQGQPQLPEAKAEALSTASSVFQKSAMQDASVTQRLTFWRGTLRMVADHPLLGVGPGGWVRAYPPYDGGTTITTEGYHRRPHNDYLWIASEYGLIGLGIYLWFLLAGCRGLLTMARSQDRLPRIAAPAFALSLLSILGAAFFSFPREQPQTALFPYAILGFAAGAVARRRIDLRGRPSGGLLLAFLLLISLGTLEITRRRIGFDRHYLRAFSYGVSAQNWPAVLTEARYALEYGNFRSDLLFFKGLALQNLGRYPEAEAAYRQTLAYAPHTWYAHDGLGFVYLHQGRLQDALKHCQTALSLCPSATYIHTNLGVIYYQMGDPGRAEQEFRAVLLANPNDAETHFNLGSLYQVRGQLDSAIVHYQQALRIAPNLSQAHLALGNVSYALGNYRDALTAYQGFLQLAQGDTANVQSVRERMVTCERQIKK